MLVVPRKICRLGGSAGSVVEYVSSHATRIPSQGLEGGGKDTPIRRTEQRIFPLPFWD